MRHLQVTYAADARNMHRVSPVVSGQRFTLTMWLTKDLAHSEDPRVIQTLQSGVFVVREYFSEAALLDLLYAVGLHAGSAGLAPERDSDYDTLSLWCAGYVGLPSTLYLGECGRDVRNEKLSELGFAAVREGKEFVLRKLLKVPTSTGNNSTSFTQLDVNDCDTGRDAAIAKDQLTSVVCDDLQQAIAVAAFWQWNCSESVSDSLYEWSTYITKLQKHLVFNRTEWDEVQALFTLEQ